MSRNISSAARASIFSGSTDDVFAILLTIDHADMAEPIRVCSGGVDMTSRGNSFIAFPFDLSLPDDDGDRPPRARLAIDNIDRRIVAAVRGLTSPPSVLIEIVRAAAPDVVEATFADFKFTGITYDSKAVKGNLSIEDFTAEPYPAATFSPSLFPGLF